jgi:hypothetical protein
VTGPLAQLEINPHVCHPSEEQQEPWPPPAFAVFKHGQWGKKIGRSFYDAKNRWTLSCRSVPNCHVLGTTSAGEIAAAKVANGTVTEKETREANTRAAVTARHK